MNASYVQRLFLKHTKTVLLIASNLLTPKVGIGKNLSKLLNDKRKKKYYNYRISYSLCDLRVNEFVAVQLLNFKDMWKLNWIVLQHALCSYVIEVDGKLLTRNRKFIKTWCDNFNFDDSSNCQDLNVIDKRGASHSIFFNVKITHTRVIRPPARYEYYLMN